jgi:6-phosphogluconolactonase (cycloisomerase 2 family)
VASPLRWAQGLPRSTFVALVAILLVAVAAAVAAVSMGSDANPRSALAVPNATVAPPLLRPIAGVDACLSGNPGTIQGRTCSRTVRGQYGPAFVTMSPDGRFVYSLSPNSGYRIVNNQPVDIVGGTIVTFRRDADTGKLTQLPGADGCIRDVDAVINAVTKPCEHTAQGIAGAKMMVISSDGLHAYVAGLNNDAIAAFDRDPDTGVLHQLPGDGACVQGASFPNHDCPVKGTGLHGIRWLALSPDGTNLYAAAPANDAVAAFAVDPSSGAVTQLPGDQACVGDHLARIDSCGTHALAINYPRSLVVSPDGKNVYVVSDTADSAFPGDPADGSAVSVLQRDGSSGALSQLPGDGACIQDSVTAHAATGCSVTGIGLFQPYAVEVSPDGKNVYVGAGASHAGALTSYSRDQSTGALTQFTGPSACFGLSKGCTKAAGVRDVGNLTMTPDGSRLYAVSFLAYTVSALDRDRDSGTLTPVPGGCVKDRLSKELCPVTALGLNGPRNVVLSPDGRFAYVSAETAGTITTFAVRQP